jgi:hypothetical protein
VSQSGQHRPDWLHHLAQALLVLVAGVVLLTLMRIGFDVQLPTAYLVFAALLLLSLPPFYLLWRAPPGEDSLRWRLWGPYAFILPMVSIFVIIDDLVWKTLQTPEYGWPGFFGFVAQMAASFLLAIGLLVAQAKLLSARRTRLEHERQPLEHQLWGAEAFPRHQDEGPEDAGAPWGNGE